MEQLARAGAIYLKARVTIGSPVDGKKRTGSYEYWERGGRYRVRLVPGLGYPLSDIAFDGKFLQGRAGEDMVQISRGDERLTPLPDGPLALALASLRVSDPVTCTFCQLRVADLAKAAQQRREVSVEIASAESTMRTGSFDAGAQRIGESDAAGNLVRLAWPVDSSNQRLEITLSDYQSIAGTGAAFPMTLTETLLPNGATVQYTVEKVDLSPRFQDDVFDIYSTAPKLAFLATDEKGVVHKRFLRYVPSPGEKPCSAKARETGGKQ